MAKVTIKLAPVELLGLGSYSTNFKTEVVKELASKYEVGKSYETTLAGLEAAREAFDLTNNPARQTEREARYGRYRSVSVGDIVVVDGKEYFCDNFGWLEL